MDVLQEQLVELSRLEICIVLDFNDLMLKALVLRNKIVQYVLHLFQFCFRHFSGLS